MSECTIKLSAFLNHLAFEKCLPEHLANDGRRA